jgi:hypothetical protein
MHVTRNNLNPKLGSNKKKKKTKKTMACSIV